MSVGCVICSEMFLSTDPQESKAVAIKACGHTFHNSCLNNWFNKSATCPICRHPASAAPINIQQLHLQSISGLDSSMMVHKLQEEATSNEMDLDEMRKENDKLQQENRNLRLENKKLRRLPFKDMIAFEGYFNKGRNLLDPIIDLTESPVPILQARTRKGGRSD